jgi:hypothetical protein
MRARQAEPTLLAMAGGTERVIVDVALDGDDISGRLEGSDGGIREFFGWIGLATALVAVAGPSHRPENDSAGPVDGCRSGRQR